MEEESNYINRLQKTKDIIKLSSIALILIVWSIVSFIAYQNKKLQEKNVNISSYEECLKASGSIIQESYPQMCVAKDGKRFVQPLSEEEQKNLKPPNDTVKFKTYRNNEYNFEFDYPPSWYILRNDSLGLTLSNLYIDPANNVITPYPGEVIVNFTFTHAGSENYTSKPIESVSNEGVNIVRQGRFIDKSGSLAITSIYRKNDPEINQFENDINIILSTFKFID